MDVDTLEARLRDAGIPDDCAALLAAVAEPSLRLTAHAADDATIAVGASKLGGAPDLPAGAPWPRHQGRPQAFLAQLDLATLHASPGGDRLPPAGLLSFFCDADQAVDGHRAADRGGWAVVYTPGEIALVRTAPPEELPAPARHRACTIEMSTELTVAPDDSADVETLGLSFAVVGAYADVVLEVNEAAPPAPIHRVLGHSQPLHGDMQIVAHEGARLPRTRAHQWRLLFQIGSDAGAGIVWGDHGSAYFWIHETDLAARRFDRCWCVVQQ